MSKQPYLTPEIDILDIQIENGFAQSGDPTETQSISFSSWYNDEF